MAWSRLDAVAVGRARRETGGSELAGAGGGAAREKFGVGAGRWGAAVLR